MIANYICTLATELFYVLVLLHHLWDMIHGSMHITGDFFFPVSCSGVAEICEVFNTHCLT